MSKSFVSALALLLAAQLFAVQLAGAGEIGEPKTLDPYEPTPVGGVREWAPRVAPKYAKVESFDAKAALVIGWTEWSPDEKTEAEADKRREELLPKSAAEPVIGPDGIDVVESEEIPEGFPPVKLFAHQVQIRIQRDDLFVFDAAGERLKAEEIEKRLKKGAPVLFSRDGRMLDKFYRPLLKDDVLIVACKRDAEWVTYRSEKPEAVPGAPGVDYGSPAPVGVFEIIEEVGPAAAPPAPEGIDADFESAIEAVFAPVDASPTPAKRKE